MEQFQTIWIKKEEVDEVPDEPGSMLVEGQMGISCFTDFISEEPEVVLEVDETENIVVTSTRYESDSTRLIKNGESCGISFDDPFNQAAIQEDWERGTEESAYASICGTHVRRLMSEEGSVLGTRLKCSSREKEFLKFGCSFCLQSFPSKYRLIMHVFNHIDSVQPPKYVCKSCGEVFPSKVSLKKHLKMSEGEEDVSAGNTVKFDCGEDQKTILKDDDLVTKETEKKSSSIKSRIISKKTCSEVNNIHTKTHNAENEDIHDNYGAPSTTDNGNIKAVQLTAKRPHKCDVCSKSFTRLGILKTHELKHTGVRAHKCEICGKSFTQVGTLNRHVSQHTGKKTHKCDVCGKCFAQLIRLKIHSLIHTGIRPYKCDICGKCFTESTTFKRHKLIHTGIRAHKCDVCDKTFTLLGDLKRHTLIHTGMKPHTCNICGKSFRQLAHLKGHILNSHCKEMN